MKTLKKLIFFIITYNIIFSLFLNLQYIYRFNKVDDISSSIMYALIFSLYFTIIPLACFCISWFISYKFLIQKLQINSVLNQVLILLITVILSYMFTEIMVHDFFVSLMTVISTILTLSLLFYIFRKDGSASIKTT